MPACFPCRILEILRRYGDVILIIKLPFRIAQRTLDTWRRDRWPRDPLGNNKGPSVPGSLPWTIVHGSHCVLKGLCTVTLSWQIALQSNSWRLWALESWFETISATYFHLFLLNGIHAMPGRYFEFAIRQEQGTIFLTKLGLLMMWRL